MSEIFLTRTGEIIGRIENPELDLDFAQWMLDLIFGKGRAAIDLKGCR